MAADPSGYQERRSALNRQFLGYCLGLPALAEAIFLILAVTVSADWVIAMVLLPLFVPVMVAIGLLYRCWPTGIRMDETGITIGAIGSPSAATRRPTVNHQAWGIFTCPWSSVHDVRVVTDPGELRRIARSPKYYTFTNRFFGKRDMTYCNIGILTAPFMHAALVAEIYPSGVEGASIRPARYFNNYKNGYFSRRVPPRMSDTWIVPTRCPQALEEALKRYQLP
jgi:hypothetical protein